MTLKQKRLYLKLNRNSFSIFFPANDIVCYREFISNRLHVHLKQPCPTRGAVEGFVRPVFSFSCSDKYPAYWQPLLILIIFNLPFLMQAVLSTTLIRGITRGARGHKSPGALSLWGAEGLQGRRKLTTMSQTLSSIYYIYFQNISGLNMGTPNLLLAPGDI